MGLDSGVEDVNVSKDWTVLNVRDTASVRVY